MADVRLGGLAIDCQLGSSDYFAADGVEGLTVWFTVIYRVAENDPAVNRA